MGSFPTKADADRAVAVATTDGLRGVWASPTLGKRRLADWVDQWRATTTDLAPTTRVRDEWLLRGYILPAFGATALAEIGQLNVRSWVAELTASGLAPNTVHKAYQVLSKALSAAVDAGSLAVTPCRSIPLPKVQHQEMRFLSSAELAQLAVVIKPRYRALVLVGGYSGLRIGEMAGLRRGRVDVLRSRIEVVEKIVEVRGELLAGGPKTRAGRRQVPLPRPVAEELAVHLERFAGPEPDALIFAGPDGGALRARQWRARHWVPAVTDAGLAPLRPHDLRHTAVALWIAQGASPKQIAAWAGHTSVSVVLDRYGHLFPGHEDAVMQRLAEGYTPPAPRRDADIVTLEQ
ncbi:MAG TPA: tyrosine-type recombinase/integrase [Acidimicrobiia bacterium]|nr:tyrosine-type recombinase/integrase [Acidimicrobiia bacterium]